MKYFCLDSAGRERSMWERLPVGVVIFQLHPYGPKIQPVRPPGTRNDIFKGVPPLSMSGEELCGDVPETLWLGVR